MVKTQDVDSDLLDEYIGKSGLKIGYIVEKLGISSQAFYQKRTGAASFRASEVYVLCDLLNIPEDVSTKIFCIESCEKKQLTKV